MWCDLGNPTHGEIFTGLSGYLKLADSYDFQEWNFEGNGFKVRGVSLSQ